MARRREFMRADYACGARIYFMFDVERGRVIHFVINIALALENGVCYDVYRCDTCHGFLHEQRFWQSGRKIALDGEYTEMFKSKKTEVLDNYQRWITLFRRKKGIWGH